MYALEWQGTVHMRLFGTHFFPKSAQPCSGVSWTHHVRVILILCQCSGIVKDAAAKSACHIAISAGSWRCLLMLPGAEDCSLRLLRSISDQCVEAPL